MGNNVVISAIKKRLEIADRAMRQAVIDGDLDEARRQLANRDRYNTALRNEHDKNDYPHPNVRKSPFKA